MHTSHYCIVISSQCIQNKLLKTGTLETKKLFKLFLFQFFETCFLLTQVFSLCVSKWLYFSHSSILEFGGWAHKPRSCRKKSPDSARPWLLRQQI